MSLFHAHMRACVFIFFFLCTVGDNMHSASGVSGRFFNALGRANINVLAISQGSSERNISAVVDTKQAARALRAVHSGTC
jgi:aspartokinase/homoserine dehydrogenase 1